MRSVIRKININKTESKSYKELDLSNSLDKKIPKIIHQIWIGDKPAPKKLMNTWKEKNPDFKYKFWNEENLKEINFECQDKIDGIEEINGKADIYRWEILYNFGGIFIDADSFCIDSFDDFLLSRKDFFCWESEKHMKGLVSTGTMGFVKNHPFLRMTIDHIKHNPVSRRETGKKAWETVGPKLLTNIYQRYPKKIEIEVFPSYSFLPQWKKNPYFYDRHGKVYAYQEWGSTYNSYENMNSKTVPSILLPPEKYYSVLITSYNTKNEYVEECLNSIKNQKGYFGIELVWINDGSSEEITKELENILNNFIMSCRFMKLKYKRLESNKGIAFACNRGLELCEEELIFKMDSDDKMVQDRMIKQIYYMEKNKDLVWLSGSIKYGSSVFKMKNMTLEKFKKNPSHWFCNHAASCYRKKQILDLGGYTEEYKTNFEDFDLELKVLKKYGRIDKYYQIFY